MILFIFYIFSSLDPLLLLILLFLLLLLILPYIFLFLIQLLLILIYILLLNIILLQNILLLILYLLILYLLRFCIRIRLRLQIPLENRLQLRFWSLIRFHRVFLSLNSLQNFFLFLLIQFGYMSFSYQWPILIFPFFEEPFLLFFSLSSCFKLPFLLFDCNSGSPFVVMRHINFLYRLHKLSFHSSFLFLHTFSKLANLFEIHRPFKFCGSFG